MKKQNQTPADKYATMQLDKIEKRKKFWEAVGEIIPKVIGFLLFLACAIALASLLIACIGFVSDAVRLKAKVYNLQVRVNEMDGRLSVPIHTVNLVRPPYDDSEIRARLEKLENQLNPPQTNQWLCATNQFTPFYITNLFCINTNFLSAICATNSLPPRTTNSTYINRGIILFSHKF